LAPGVMSARERDREPRVVGRWPFPVGLSPDQPSIGRGFRHTTHTTPLASRWKTTRTIAVMATAALNGARPRRHCCKCRSGSWAPLLGLFKDRPSVDTTVYGPRTRQRRALGLPCPGRGPSLLFLPAATACSIQGLRACCIPQPTMGFAWFRACCRQRMPHTRPFPQAQTLRSFPLRFWPKAVTSVSLPGSPTSVPLPSFQRGACSRARAALSTSGV
jgi:hypothetical protein